MREYKSQKELYEGLKPAMNVKLANLKRSSDIDILYEDIWKYLSINKWKNSVDLTLGEMVNDIIHVNNIDIINYVKNKGDNMGEDE